VVLLAEGERTLGELSQRLFGSEEAWLFKITPAHLEALSMWSGRCRWVRRRTVWWWEARRECGVAGKLEGGSCCRTRCL